MLDGEHPVRIWREQRGFSPAYLAAKAGLSINDLHAIESGRKADSIEALKALAVALDLTIDDLVD